MQFKIPQNVDIEDKILVFLTIKQLIILVLWAWISYILYLIMAKSGISNKIWWPLSTTIMFLTFAIAFLKINFLPFHKWLALLISRITIPQKRFFFIWNIWWSYFWVLAKKTTSKKEKKEKENTWKLSFNKIKWEWSLDNFFDNEERNEFNKRFWKND
jgi:hypothetical protein